MERFVTLILATALLCAPLQPQNSATAAGIAYVIDSAVDAGAAPGAFKTFAAVVVFAHGRGRFDVVKKGDGPTIRADEITIAPALGGPGDYYLFDSTGFVLVRPATKTFSSFAIEDASYNYQNKRDGWPAWFRFHTLHIDTVAGMGTTAGGMMQHARTQLFWHLDHEGDSSSSRVMGRDSIRIVAAGHLTVHDVPPGEVSVFRWFGPSEALANLPPEVGSLPTGRVRITTVAVLRPPGAGSEPVNFITLHQIIGLARASVDLSRLKLPSGFTETQWPGYERFPGAPPLSSDSGARWRTAPN
jgi:hypothetical protein